MTAHPLLIPTNRLAHPTTQRYRLGLRETTRPMAHDASTIRGIMNSTSGYSISQSPSWSPLSTIQDTLEKIGMMKSVAPLHLGVSVLATRKEAVATASQWTHGSNCKPVTISRSTIAPDVIKRSPYRCFLMGPLTLAQRIRLAGGAGRSSDRYRTSF